LGRKKKKRGKKKTEMQKTSIAETYPANPETKKREPARRKIIEKNIELKSTFFLGSCDVALHSVHLTPDWFLQVT